MRLADLVERLRRFAAGDIDRAALRGWMEPLLAADPLDVAQSDDTPWRDAADDTRLFWRLVYIFDAGDEPEERDRALARRVVACLESTRDSALTHELLPLVADQERFCAIVRKHAQGIISRTGFLNVVAESGYPSHAKLWLEHAGVGALARLVTDLEAGAYREAAAAMERRPE